MRANEFINEGWYDDAKAKVKQVASSPVGQKLGGLAKSAGTAMAKTASSAAQGAVNMAKTAGAGINNTLNPTNQANVAAKSTQIFIKKFTDTLNATQKRQTQLGEPFDLATFANAYMRKYQWKPGQLQTQLDSAVKANDTKQLALVMDKIGSLNTVDPTAKGPELDMTQPQAAPVAAAPAPVVQMKIGAGPNDTMNPADPADARILAMLKQQGKI